MSKNLQTTFPFYLLFLGIILLSTSNFFFWDTVNIVAAPALFFYETNFSSFILPTNIDTGHIPALGFYLAIVWKILGKSLLVSHLSMLPFVFGVIYQLHQLIKQFIENPFYQQLALGLILADATFLSQSILISPDMVLLFFLLLGLNSIIKHKNNFLIIALIGLFIISLRGSIAAFSLLIIDIALNYKTNYASSFKLVLKRIIYIYTFPFLILLTLHFYHYLNTGWIGTHENSPWVAGKETNNLKGVIYNIGILAWRILDFGRITVVVSFIFLLIYSRKMLFSNPSSKKIILISSVLLLFFSLPFLYFKMQTQHRYLLPFLILFLFFVAYLITNLTISSTKKTLFFSLLILASLSGNFWVYPNSISQGWDSTLGHLPYYNLQQKMNDYLTEHNIEFNKVGADFPILANHKILFLTNKNCSFKPKEVGQDNYILYSNLFNGFSDDELNKLNLTYHLVKEYQSPTVFVQLYKMKE